MSNKKRTVVKVTKIQLLEAVVCCRTHSHELIKTYWPKYRKKITLIEFVEKAREVGTSYFNVQYMLFKLDRDGWREAGGAENCFTTAGCRNVVNKYLELLGGTT